MEQQHNPLLSLIHQAGPERDELTAALEAEHYRVRTFTSLKSFCSDPLYGSSECVVLYVDEVYLSDLDALVAILDLERKATVVVVTGNATLAGLLLEETPAEFDVLVTPVTPATLIRTLQRAGRRKRHARPSDTGRHQ